MNDRLKNFSKTILVLLFGISFLLAWNCGEQNSEKSDTNSNQEKSAEAPKAGVEKTKEEKIASGKKIYSEICVACHLGEGQGSPGSFPPLAKSDFLNKDKKRAIHTVVKGISGPITVNGKKYDNVMPPQTLGDEDVADVLTYVYNSWGNAGHVIHADEVKPER
ncbi:MAG: cytochrome c [Leptospiraceae bacterium]|nr:cytochrome c [Leptospiraceae bacterium]MCK6380195.1 cytochrome c [Leptospiraceae bacterium]